MSERVKGLNSATNGAGYLTKFFPALCFAHVWKQSMMFAALKGYLSLFNFLQYVCLLNSRLYISLWRHANEDEKPKSPCTSALGLKLLTPKKIPTLFCNLRPKQSFKCDLMIGHLIKVAWPVLKWPTTLKWNLNDLYEILNWPDMKGGPILSTIKTIISQPIIFLIFRQWLIHKKG